MGLHAELFAEAAALDAGDARAPFRAIRTALAYRPSRLSLDLDEGRTVRTRALVTSISNGPFAGFGFTVAPGARLDDGKLDVRVFERFSRWELCAISGRSRPAAGATSPGSGRCAARRCASAGRVRSASGPTARTWA